MATATASNRIKYKLAQGAVDFENDTFTVILMQSGFTFDKDAHHAYADVSSDELAAGNGYTQKDKAIVFDSLTESDANDRAEALFGNAQWDASGGSIGPAAAAVVIDETADDTIVGCYAFDADVTVPSGDTWLMSGFQFNIG